MSICFNYSGEEIDVGDCDAFVCLWCFGKRTEFEEEMYSPRLTLTYGPHGRNR